MKLKDNNYCFKLDFYANKFNNNNFSLYVAVDLRDYFARRLNDK